MTNKACAICIGYRQQIARLEKQIKDASEASPGYFFRKQQRDRANSAFSIHARQVHGR
jgi:hypothetical protein